jgi:hypothetical protein
MMEEDDALENMRKTAFHEAGHVFLHEVFEIPYKSVQINENAQVGEHEGVVHGDEEASIEIDELIYACICFSGAVAEDKYTYPSYSPKNYGLSIQEGTDLDKYQQLGLHKNYFDPLLDSTIKIIIDNWELVSKIANALIKEKELRSEEVKQILGNWELKEKQYRYTLDIEEISRKLNLEIRVVALETELAQMRQMLSIFVQKETPWWLKVAGSSENDPTFDEANRLGQEWRKSAE